MGNEGSTSQCASYLIDSNHHAHMLMGYLARHPHPPSATALRHALRSAISCPLPSSVLVQKDFLWNAQFNVIDNSTEVNETSSKQEINQSSEKKGGDERNELREM